jgi:iron complex transport system substrate-binding protein
LLLGPGVLGRTEVIASALAFLLATGPRAHLGPPVPAQVQRVVTMAPSLSEMVLALGARERLVGVTRFDDDRATAGLPRIGGYNDPQPEAVLALHPDLALAEPAPQNHGSVDTVARLGVPVETFPLSTISDIEQAIRGIAALLGVQRRGAELVAQLEDARAAARANARKPPPRALLVFGLQPLVVAGPGSFAGELLSDAGGRNAAADSDKPFFRLSAEAAVRSAPDVIVLCGIEAQPGRAPIRGLEKTRVATLRTTALLHPGPRLPEALADLAAALHP